MTSDKMKYVFWGTSRISQIVLEDLMNAAAATHATSAMPSENTADAIPLPAAIVASPDKPAGRQRLIVPVPTKQLIIERELIDRTPVLQPEKLNDPAFAEQLRQLAPDVFIVISYAKIIPQSILDIPRLGAIGIHPSLLPKYRGSSPFQTALLDGATASGVTLYLMDAKMDHGSILGAVDVAIAHDDTYTALMEKMAHAGAAVLIETLPKFLRGEITPQVQDETNATFTRKFTTEDGFVDEGDLRRALTGNDTALATSIYNKIRAFTPEPGVWTLHAGKRIKLLAALLSPAGALVLDTIQREGKTPVPGRDLVL